MTIRRLHRILRSSSFPTDIIYRGLTACSTAPEQIVPSPRRMTNTTAYGSGWGEITCPDSRQTRTMFEPAVFIRSFLTGPVAENSASLHKSVVLSPYLLSGVFISHGKYASLTRKHFFEDVDIEAVVENVRCPGRSPLQVHTRARVLR